jgi:hypothetical protein
VKIFEALENFLDALGFLYVTEIEFKNLCDKNGITFRMLPKTMGSELATKAQFINDFGLAKAEMRSNLTLLERLIPDFNVVPADEEAILSKLSSLLEENRVYQLCQRGVDDPRAAITAIREFQEGLSSDVTYGEYSSIMDVSLDEWTARVEQGEAVVSVQGFEKLCQMIGGLNPGRIGILLADTGFGKTNLGLTLALRARHTMGVAYANMEMSLEDISKRIAILESGIKHKEFYEQVRLKEFKDRFRDDGKGFFLTEGRTLSPMQIKVWIRTLNKKSPLGLVVIDYDQCLELGISRDVPEWKAIQNTLSDFDNFAKEVGCFILVLAQLNREGEISSSHRSLYKAHTVLHFRNDEDHGPVIHAKKNRHGRSNACLAVDYDEESSGIIERDLVEASQKKQKRTIEIKKPKASYAPRGKEWE